MNEKKKQVKQATGGSGPSIFDNALPLPENKMVNISSGPYSEDLPVAGSTVGEIRKRFSDRFDIDEKAQSIVNGNVVGDDVVLQAGESLMFVRHAGEKGGNRITLTGGTAELENDAGGRTSMPLSALVKRMGPGISTGNSVIPHGVRAIVSQGNQTLMVWERPPHVASLSWIAKDSPHPYGSGTTYRQVRISLPYLIIVASFSRQGSDVVLNTHSNECFFRNEPLRSLDDELLYPALLNCSVMKANGAPLAWICTQYLKNKTELADPFANGLEAVRCCLLETSFNLSSEHHEGNSWFGASRKSIPQIETVEKWEKETKKDPLFATGVPWLTTEHSVKDFAARTFKRLGAADTSVKTAEDVARIIING